MTTKQWPRVSLGELIRLERRPVKVDPERLYQEIGIYCFGRGIFHKAPRTGFEVGNKDLFLMKEGDFILQVTFAWEGAVALVSHTEDGMHGSTRYPTFRVDESRCIPQFLLNYFKTHEGLQQLVKICPGSAGRNRVLSIKRIPEVLVPLPPLAEQRRVVTRIEELAAQIHEARTFRQRAAEEAEALGHANRNQSFHELGSRCSRARLDSVAACRLGKMLDPRFKTGVGSTPYLRNANVQWDRLYLNDVYQMDFKDEERTEFALQTDDILVCEGGDIGKAAIWNDEIPDCCFQKALHRVRCDRERILPRFMLHHLFWAANEGHWQELKTQTTIPRLTGVKLKAYQVFVPPLPEQRRIVSELDALQSEVNALKRVQSETAAELDALLPAILDREFNGEP
jgi:type I restriction enzyme S subunit